MSERAHSTDLERKEAATVFSRRVPRACRFSCPFEVNGQESRTDSKVDKIASDCGRRRRSKILHEFASFLATKRSNLSPGSRGKSLLEERVSLLESWRISLERRVPLLCVRLESWPASDWSSGTNSFSKNTRIAGPLELNCNRNPRDKMTHRLTGDHYYHYVT